MRGARWRFRLVIAVLMVLVVLALVAGYRELTGANAQDPGLNDTPNPRQSAVRVPQLPGR